MKARKEGGSRKTTKFLGVWLPNPMLTTVDALVLQSDSDRSKFVRMAIKEKIARTDG